MVLKSSKDFVYVSAAVCVSLKAKSIRFGELSVVLEL